MQMSHLTQQEVNDLKALHKQVEFQKEADRIKAILLMHDGYTQREIATILLIDEDTVTAWKQKFDASKTIADYLLDGYTPYQGMLSQSQKEKVTSFVEQSIISDASLVSAFIGKRFKKSYSEGASVALLHRLGFAYKQTTLIPSKYDQTQQQAFVQSYQTLEKNLKPNEVLLFVDGVHPSHNTQTSKAWIKMGAQKLVKSNTGRERLNINGAYNPKTQEVITHDDVTINAQTTITFFQKVEARYAAKKKIYLIVDNARYYRNKEIAQYVKHSRIKLLFLPPYSPNLNLIERLWKFMRKKLLKSVYYETFKEFKAAVLGFFEQIARYADELKTFIGTEFHLLGGV
jgi:transposase